MVTNEVLQGGAWPTAVHLLVRWREQGERVDTLLERAEVRALGRSERGRCQSLLFGTVRHLGRVEAALEPLLARPPRAMLWAILVTAGYELIEAAGDAATEARVVHHAVERAKTLASGPEARLVNAVVRKLVPVLGPGANVPGSGAGDVAWAAWFSHPEWLVARWRERFGVETTLALLAWNQKAAAVHVRWRGVAPAAGEVPAWLRPTPWGGFYEVAPGHWAELEPWLAEGRLYVQDPATRLAVELLAPTAGETVLDLCAAPGGKSLALADALGGAGRVVAMDLAGARLARLKSNLAHAKTEVEVVGGDVLREGQRVLAARGLPESYAAVLIDVPCSNTGVMRHRVDVKWRLQETDFRKHGLQQRALLEAAARLVAPGGRLVYSTCSLDPEENEQVVEGFARQSGGEFTVETARAATPWADGHDGAAVFRLRRAL